MNDFFFLIIQENLVENSVAWFSVVPQDVRSAARAPVHGLTDVSEYQAAFLVSRTLTAGIHILITCWLAVLAWRRPLEELPGLAFLSVASFLLLLPTLNPWYWIWTMPLLPFARRSWLVLSGLLVVYYLRFWLKYQYGSADILGTGYSGRLFFDFVVVWFEYVPLFVLLIAEGRQWIFLRDRSQTVQRP